MKNVRQISLGAYASFETCRNTYDSVIDILNKNIEGDLIECGVGAGSQIALMKLALIRQKTDRKIWAYDSYQGIPYGIKDKDIVQAGIGDIETNEKDGLLESTGIANHSLENVKQTIIDSVETIDNIEFIEGWFQDTINKHPNNTIALLRLDADLYESTKICLEKLFPLVSEKGIVIIDDWNLYGCQLACNEYFEKIGYKPNYKLIALNNPVFFIK